MPNVVITILDYIYYCDHYPGILTKGNISKCDLLKHNKHNQFVMLILSYRL